MPRYDLPTAGGVLLPAQARQRGPAKWGGGGGGRRPLELRPHLCSGLAGVDHGEGPSTLSEGRSPGDGRVCRYGR